VLFWALHRVRNILFLSYVCLAEIRKLNSLLETGPASVMNSMSGKPLLTCARRTVSFAINGLRNQRLIARILTIHLAIYRMSQEECAKLRESVPYVKVYRYNPKHLYPKLNGYEDNGQRKVRTSCGFKYCNLHS
jgi:hypothetical protein